MLAGAVAVDGRRVGVDVAAADARSRRRGERCCRSSDKTGLAELGRGLVDRGFELVSTGGTARALRDAGLPVTDVSAVTGFARDARRAGEDAPSRDPRRRPRRSPPARAHREALLAAGIAPFELVVVNLYPFAAAAEREGITLDELVEEIDIGGPDAGPGGSEESRLRGGRHLARPATRRCSPRSTSPAASRSGSGRRSRSRRSGTPPPTTPGSPPSCRAAWTRPASTLPPEPGLPRSRGPVPARARAAAREGRDPALRREPAPAGGALPAHGPARPRRPTDRSRPARRRSRARRSRTTTCSTPRPRPRSRGCFAGRPASIVKHTNPCGAAERPTLLEAWQAALAGDPDAAFGGVVALTRPVTRRRRARR